MKVKDLRDLALKKANNLEVTAAKRNENCLLMPMYQNCLMVIKVCDEMAGRTDEAAEELAKKMADLIEIKGDNNG